MEKKVGGENSGFFVNKDMFSFVPFLLVACGGGSGVFGNAELRIKDASEFIEFAESGNSYSGTTVFLESDITLSGTFYPITCFLGTFDGQGHVLSGLNIVSNGQFVGLFDFLEGATIKNVVLDSSCTAVDSTNYNFPYIGGIIGYCNTNFGPCIIENNVNMASITSTLSPTDNVYVGGIIGGFSSSSSGSDYLIMKNCVNYGSIEYHGTSNNTYIGGIIGFLFSFEMDTTIQNCFNYGSITPSGSTLLRLYVGGISGSGYSGVIENCLSSGKITILNGPQKNYVGTITSYSDFQVIYCFWTSDVGSYTSSVGSGTPSNTTGTPTSSVSAESAVDSLNARVTSSNKWNKWLFNPTKALVTIKVNTNKEISLSSEAILLPALADSDWRDFSWWYSDGFFIDPFTSSSVTGATTLYGMWDKYIVLFDPNGGKVSQNSSIVAYGGQYGTLPTPTRGEYTFSGWFTEEVGGEKIESGAALKILKDHTLYAHWTNDKRTIRFMVNGGSECKPITQNYNTEIVLPEPTKTGYTFVCWCSDRKLTTKYTVTLMPTENVILYANWSINQYTIAFEVDGGNECKNITQDNNTQFVLPEPTKTGYTFVHWCSDSELSSEYTETTVPARNVTLYAKWTINQYNITFIFNNGNETEMRTLDYNKEIVYPESVEKTGYTLNGWSPKPERMPAEDITVTAQWTANKYTVAFDVDGGNALSESESKKEVAYDSPYGELPEATKTGYSFDGWFTEKNESVKNETIVKILSNHTLRAKWSEIESSYVEIVIKSKGLDEEEIKKIIEEYTDSDFTIVKIEDGESEGTKVIIKFTDTEKASEFVRETRESIGRNPEENKLGRIAFYSKEYEGSFSFVLSPFSFISLLVM